MDRVSRADGGGSGAAATALPTALLVDYELRVTPGSRARSEFTAANGDPTFNDCENMPALSAKDGSHTIQLYVQVCDVHTAMGSVMQLVGN